MRLIELERVIEGLYKSLEEPILLDDIAKASKFIKNKEKAVQLCRGLVESEFGSFNDYEVTEDYFQLKDYSDFRFKIDVPSGVIVFADCFRSLVNKPPFEIGLGGNDIKHKIKYIKKHEALGMAHGFVGDTGLTLYWSEKEQAIHFGAEETDIGFPVDETLEELGHICADLWWYSVMDKDEFLSIGGDIESVANLIEVPSGTYEFEHSYGVSERGWDADCYAIARKIK